MAKTPMAEPPMAKTPMAKTPMAALPMAVLPPACPWRLDIVRMVLLGTHDPKSPLSQLLADHRLLQLIIRDYLYPELFLNVLIAEMLEVNPGVTKAKLRQYLNLNPNGSIKNWNLRNCGLRALPELFGAVHITDNLWLFRNELRSLPKSFWSITVGGSLWLDDYQYRSLLPDSLIPKNLNLRIVYPEGKYI